MKKMDLEADFVKEFENFSRKFLELEEKSKRDEMRCLMLEIEVQNLKKKNEELEGKITMIQKVMVDSTNVANDDENLFEVMAENKVLECEKRKAETEICLWKEKVKELESSIHNMNANVEEDNINMVSNGTKEVFHSQEGKTLLFEEDGCPNKKMAPCTPGVAQSPLHRIIDISDVDVTYNETPKVKEVSGSRKCGDFAKNNLQETSLELVDDEHMDEFIFHSSNTRCAKRKRAAKIITSDDESSYDDNALICTLKTQHSSTILTDSAEEVEENVSRRRLRRLKTLESKNKQDKSSFDLNKTIGSTEDEEDGDGVYESESEGDSLGGFIVDSPENVSKCDSEGGDSADESEISLNASSEKIGRKKILNLKWDLEGDMLSDLGKDPELCMRAVCAIYRQQTADEKASKETMHRNKRGFSQIDAYKASKLAEFLTEGDPNGDLNKTVEELKGYDPNGIEQCMDLAPKYSKQLFTIYQNKEDPYFLPR